MKYLELGEVFKINVDHKIIYLKTEIDTSITPCKNCYFNTNPQYCDKFVCSQIDREDDINVIFKQINPIQIVYIVFAERLDKFTKRVCIYPTEEDAKKEVEELNKLYPGFNHYYKFIEYYPYGIINSIKEVKIN